MNNIIRVDKNKNNPYVLINKDFLNDKNLSWKAKGLMAYLLSKPDDWEIFISQLQKCSTDGRDSTSNAIKELIKNGYIQRKDYRLNGRFKSIYTVFENKITVTENPYRYGKTETEKPKRKNRNGLTETVNPSLLNNEQLNNDLLNNNTTTEEEEIKEINNINVVVNLIDSFNKKYNGNLDLDLIKKLIDKKTYEVVEECINVFDKYVTNADKVENTFYDFCMKYKTSKAYKINTKYKKVTRLCNYKQREYEEDKLKSIMNRETEEF
jgi:hypothetical protein